jgi:signal peptidase I
LARLLTLTLFAAFIALAFRAVVGEPIYIASPSMEPTLKVGQRAILDKVSFRFRGPQRGEIIVFQSPTGEDHDSVKRVIALPGETIELKEKKVVVNGQELAEPYIQHVRADERLQGDDFPATQVPAGHLFVLGDNRDESNDSSVWRDAQGHPMPFLPLRRVLGKVRPF